jgi:ATP-dependent RNA helicase DHR2
LVGKKRVTEGTEQKKANNPLKVVVMSATADVEGLVRFFKDDAVDARSSREGNSGQHAGAQEDKSGRVATCFVEGRQYPVQSIYLSTPVDDAVEEALKTIFEINRKEPLPGDILVFLTGQGTIEYLERLVNEYAEGIDKDMPKVSSSAIILWGFVLYSTWLAIESRCRLLILL